MSDHRRHGPVLIELDDTSRPGGDPPENPADAIPVGEPDVPLADPAAIELAARIAGKTPSKLSRFFLNTAVALFTFLLSVAALNYINSLMNHWPVLGWIGVGLFGLFTLAVLGIAFREYRAWGRFAQIDQIHRDAGSALARADLVAARDIVRRLDTVYAGRPEMKWVRRNLAERAEDVFDAETMLILAEAELLTRLDQDARREIEAAARMVATATAVIPLAFADVAAAFAVNLRMIRRMAEIYGGRAGSVGGWRLARTVMTHLVATGAVSAGDDLIHTVAGGGILAKLSRRFGEGVVNGALTARIGIAAMEVCRPLPFIARKKPKVGNLVTRGLAGLFGSDEVRQPSGEDHRYDPAKGE